ncbi:MAG: hypothetical protein SAJ12_02940 [Jaaginema sp. PMC 1079.18]|nr:hypothetical protein [Jaaginema sp. PMC 1080.18]MEC4849943.1 hypothetical protein [Jaaginema sp. PMC 1079.18]MEC4865160.1 hypothetical protein [Jaaginema sp. PMC 1078.18]
MKAKIITVLLTATFVVGVTGQLQSVQASSPTAIAQNPQNQSVWSLYTSPDADFSILMPGDPEVTESSTNIDAVTVKIYGFTVKRYDDTVQYLVTRINIPEELNLEAVNPEQFLEAMQQQIAAQVTGEVIASEIISLKENYPGREMTVKIAQADQTYITINRLYWVNRKLYQVSVTVPETLEPNLTGSSTGFLNSFQLLE